MTHSIMMLSVMALVITTLSKMTPSIAVQQSNDTRQNGIQLKSLITMTHCIMKLSVMMLVKTTLWKMSPSTCKE
jgi:hypothetical protein